MYFCVVCPDGEIQAADKDGEGEKESPAPAEEGEEVKSKPKKKSTRKVMPYVACGISLLKCIKCCTIKPCTGMRATCIYVSNVG